MTDLEKVELAIRRVSALLQSGSVSNFEYDVSGVLDLISYELNKLGKEEAVHEPERSI